MGMDTTAMPAEEPAELATDFSSETPAPEAGVDPNATPEAPAETPEAGGENPDEPILKTIQKLTGKITQKMRDGAQELESKDYKYVVNSILSAIDMTKITEEDMNDMLNKLQNKDSEDTTEGEPGPGGEEIAPEPVQEQPEMEQPTRIKKSYIDEFLDMNK